MKTKVLVLGASGYVGRRLMAALMASDWAEPIAAGRRARASGQMALDATNESALTQALAGVHAVVNCVSGSADTISKSALALQKAQVAQTDGPRRLVHFSSMSVYGPAIGLIHEDRPVAIGLSGYGGAKVTAEQVLAGKQTVMLRPGCIYGPDSPQWSVRIERLLRAGRIGDLGPDGDGCSNLVHVDDVVQAVMAALRAEGVGGQAYNLAMSNAPTWNEYFIAYARALEAVPVKRIGAKRLRLETRILAPALKIAEILAAKAGVHSLPAPIPPSLLRLWSQGIQLASDKAQSAFGLNWTPLGKGLSRTVAQTSQEKT